MTAQAGPPDQPAPSGGGHDRFGNSYTGGDGRQYVNLQNMKVGVLLDACKAFKGTVESMKKLNGSSGPLAGRWELTAAIDGQVIAGVFRLHQNWVSSYGVLHAGDEIEGVIDLLEPDTFWLLRRVAKEVTVEE